MMRTILLVVSLILTLHPARADSDEQGFYLDYAQGPRIVHIRDDVCSALPVARMLSCHFAFVEAFELADKLDKLNDRYDLEKGMGSTKDAWTTLKLLNRTNGELEVLLNRLVWYYNVVRIVGGRTFTAR